MSQTQSLSTTDRAAAIRAALKARHISSRQVSIRAEYFSMGSAIRVSIKDAAVPLALVKAIAEDHESIRRCEMTGDILSGGNRYVTVSYAQSALERFRQVWIDRVTAAAARVTENYLIEIDATPFLIGKDPAGYTLWRDGSLTAKYLTLAGAAEVIGAAMVPAPAEVR